jgi:dihydroorotase
MSQLVAEVRRRMPGDRLVIVVVRDGVITAVGANATVPDGAWVIEGAGKTVYPGFVDALTTLGHPAARGARPAANGSKGSID